MTNSRQKGKRGEREAAKYLASLGFGTYGDDTRRGQQHRGGRDSPDVICEALSAVHIEVKVGSPAYIDLGPRLVAAMEQAVNDAARAALAGLSPFDQAAGLERWIEVACRAAGCEPDALLGFGRGRGHMPRDTSAVRAAICEYARTFGVRYVDLAARFKASRSALLSAAKSQRDKRNRREVAA